jgi:anhydro-N-acetylmuramic acid kinase
MPMDAADWDDGGERMVAGASIGRRTGRLKAVLLRCTGEGWQTVVRAAEAVTAPAPPQDAEALGSSVAKLLASLAERTGVPLTDVEVLGLHDPPAGDQRESAVAAAVAERTGLTVVSQFSQRDAACGGRGAPLSPVADWLAFRSRKHRRLVLHLGASLTATILEPDESPRRVFSFDAGPCSGFLDGLILRLSDGRLPFDPSGHFAVQGRVAESLIADWSSHPFFLQPPPRLLEPAEFDGSFVENSLAVARELKISARDLLCTANHFVIRNLRTSLRRVLSTSTPLHDVYVAGGGAWNGLLWKLLQDSFKPTPVARCDELGPPSEAIRAVHAAILAYCVLENLPANLPSLTGAAAPRILGQVTPGSADHWDRWVCTLADRIELHRDDQEVRRAA